MIDHASLDLLAVAAQDAATQLFADRQHFDGPLLSIRGRLRIDDRDALGVEPALDDAAAIAHAFEARGAACFSSLFGDASFVLLDRRDSTLYAVRDLFGTLPLFYALRDSTLVVGRTALGVARFVGAALNERRALAYLAEAHEDAWLDETFFRGVYSLPAGHVLTFREGRVTLERYWEPVVRTLGARATPRDWSDAFRHSFLQAVDDRFRAWRNPAVLLSGGIDSCSVAVAASLRASGAAVRTISVTGDAEPEASFLKCVMGDARFEAHAVPIDIDSRFFPTPERILAVARCPTEATMFGLFPTYVAARELGVDALLDGVDGEIVLNQPLAPLLRSLARSGRLVAVWRLARTTARTRRRRSTLRIVAGTLRNAWRKPEDGFNAAAFDSLFVRSDAVQRLGLLGAIDEVGQECDSDDPHALHEWLAVRAPLYLAKFALSQQFGAESLHPLFDRRILELTLGAPHEVLYRSGAKSLLREALRDELPCAVANRHDKEDLSASFRPPLMRAHEGFVDSFFEAPHPLVEMLLDMQNLRSFWYSSAFAVNWVQHLPVVRVAYLSHWLKRESL